VHSLKDQTTTLPEGILLGAVLPRGPVEDVLVAPRHGGIRDLPKGARIGTGSLRRQAQIKSQRRDFEVVPIRGNVDTRIRKAEEGEVEAVVMARAGLQRLGLEAKITEILEPPRFLPAVGQGAIVITVRAGDQETRRLLLALSDEGTFRAVACERAFLAGIGGGCNVPAGAYAVVEGERLKLSAAVFDPEGTVEIRRERAGSSEDPAALGASLAREILEAGGRALIERARSDVAKGTPDAGGD
jgi:hydroxymethylbilane synthase